MLRHPMHAGGFSIEPVIKLMGDRAFAMQSFRTSDPDEASFVSTSAGFLDRLDIKARKNVKSPSFQIDVVSLGGVVITKYNFDNILFTGCAGGDFVNFLIHENGGWELSRASGLRNAPEVDSAALMQPDGMDFTYLSERFEAIGVGFHIPSLQRHVDTVYGILEPQQVIFDCISEAVSGCMHNVRNIARLVLDDARNSSSLLSLGNTGEELEQIMYAALLSGTMRDGRSRLARQGSSVAPRQVVRAEQFIREFADKRPITLADLVAVSGVSARALHNGFQRFRGMSPMAYLRRYRMQKVREALLAAGQDAVVAAEAARWGFLQPGRFAVEYRKMFGESPSQTIQQTVSRELVQFPRRRED